MRAVLVLSFCSLALFGAEPHPPIAQVLVEGGPAPLEFETRAGEALDTSKLRRDMKALWRSQRFSDVRVETLTEGEEVRVVFRVQPRRTSLLRNIKVDPPTPGINLGLERGAAVDSETVQRLAASVRQQLESSGHPDAAVRANLVPAGPGKANLDLHIDQGRQVDIRQVTFSGIPGLAEPALRKALKATKTKTMIPGIWHLRAGYNDDAVQSDAANLRSFYYRRGYFDAQVRAEAVQVEGHKAMVNYALDAGAGYAIRNFTLGERRIPVGANGQFPAAAICRELLQKRRDAERSGILDFAARIEIQEIPTADGWTWADAVATIATGPAYQINTITFRGNHRFSDFALRRSLLLDESAPLDEMLLRKSLARLNQTGFFEPLTERSVIVNTPPDSHRADVTIWLRERKSRSWSFSGPVGPMSVAGPLEFAISSRLPPWGRGIFELSTYAISAKFMLFAKPIGNLIPFLPNKRFIPLLSISRPALPGQPFFSGAEFVPQYGWRGMLMGYGASQARGWLRRVVETEQSITPGLPVTIASHGREGTMYCEAAKTKLDWARQIGGMAANLGFAFLPF